MCENVINLIEAITAVFNLFFVYYIFRSERKYNEQRDEKYDNMEKISRTEMWYDNLVATQVVEFLSTYFSNVENIFQRIKNDEIERNKAIEILKTDSYRCKHMIVPNIQVFSNDLSRKVYSEIQEYNEYILQEIHKSRINWYQIEMKTQKCKENIYNMIYTYDISQYINNKT